MNIFDAIHSLRPFSHPDMIGAYCYFNGHLIHRDNIKDFSEPQYTTIILDSMTESNTKWSVNCIGLDGIMRDDWFLVEEEA
jgi:hypothetical protein